jgi:hypothetical protein
MEYFQIIQIPVTDMEVVYQKIFVNVIHNIQDLIVQYQNAMEFLQMILKYAMDMELV